MSPRLAKVALFGNVAKSVTVEAGATVGAQIGTNLLMPDGSIATTAKLAALFGAGTGGASSIGTTDDLDEGQFNLWFTNRRAQDAVGAIAGNSSNITLTYTGGASLVADLTTLVDTGAGALLAISRDGKGRVTGTRAATIAGSAGRIAVINGDASTGLPTIDLALVADAGGGTLQKTAFDAYGRKTGTSAATTDDLAEGAVHVYYTDARSDARIALQKAAAGGLATLDGTGKLDASQLPALAITETFVVNTQAAMLALAAEEGDVAVRTDLSQSFILTAAPATTLANWQELLTPTGGVASFNGRTGAVTPSTGDYTAAQVGAEPTIAAGTAAQYWRGDKTWRDFATDVRAAVLTGLSTATSTVIAAADTVLGALGKLQAQITDNLLPAGYIDGLQMQWVSGTALTVTSGSAYIQGSSKVLRATSAIAKTGLSLTASTWYHVYLYDNAGTPAVEVVTTAPAAAYSGTARSKTGDTSRRYVGSARTDASGNISNFAHISDKICFMADCTVAPYRILANGTHAGPTLATVSAASVVPTTCRKANIIAQNVSASLSSQIATSGSSGFVYTVNPSAFGAIDFPLSATQTLDYYMASTTATGLYIDVIGYTYER